MYARNISTFLLNLVEDGHFKPLDLEDEIVAETLICRDGRFWIEKDGRSTSTPRFLWKTLGLFED